MNTEEFRAKLNDCEKRLVGLETKIASAVEDLKDIAWRLGMPRPAEAKNDEEKRNTLIKK